MKLLNYGRNHTKTSVLKARSRRFPIADLWFDGDLGSPFQLDSVDDPLPLGSTLQHLAFKLRRVFRRQRAAGIRPRLQVVEIGAEERPVGGATEETPCAVDEFSAAQKRQQSLAFRQMLFVFLFVLNVFEF